MIPLMLHSPDGVNRHSQPQFDRCYLGAQMLDNVTQSFVKFDDWVARELDRIGHNRLPRNCSSYEALTSIVESVSQIDQYSNASVYFPPKQSLSDHDDYEETQDELISYTSKQPLEHSLLLSSFSPLDNDQLSVHDDIDDNGNNLSLLQSVKAESNLPVDQTAPDINHLTQKNLTLAFIKLVYFCQHERMQFHLQHHQKPLELLLQLEIMFDVFAKWYSAMKELDSSVDIKQIKPSIDTGDIQTKLANILFGENIPIPSKLLSSWTMISLWVKQGQDILSVNDSVKLRQQQQLSEKWIQFGASSYYIAKRTYDLSKSNSSKKNIK
jgi:hypothetical protein